MNKESVVKCNKCGLNRVVYSKQEWAKGIQDDGKWVCDDCRRGEVAYGHGMDEGRMARKRIRSMSDLDIVVRETKEDIRYFQGKLQGLVEDLEDGEVEMSDEEYGEILVHLSPGCYTSEECDSDPCRECKWR